MARLFLLLAVCCCGTFGQYLNSIGTNYNIGNQQRSESVDANGDIRGHYSYVDPNGKTVSVHYTAGKNGFQVENGAGSQGEVEPHTTIVQPGTKYRGLQLHHSKYQKLLFTPAQSGVQAATAKQYEAYQDDLRKEVENNDLRLDDGLPAQFPQPGAQQADLYPNVPSYYQQQSNNVRYVAPIIANRVLNTQPLFERQDIQRPVTYTNFDQQSTALYSSRPILPGSRPDLREIAANPLPPAQRYLASQVQREATPITEDGQESLQIPVISYDYQQSY